jgi:hypothetical protein
MAASSLTAEESRTVLLGREKSDSVSRTIHQP